MVERGMRRAAAPKLTRGMAETMPVARRSRPMRGEATAGPGGGGGLGDVEEEEEGGDEEQGHFEAEELHAGEVDLFSDEAVEAKGSGEGESDPGELAEADGEVDDAGEGDGDGDLLAAAQALAEKEGGRGGR